MNGISPGKIEDGLWVGEVPRSEEDYVYLRALGVDTIVSLQTDEEVERYGLLPQAKFSLQARHRIVEHRYPIEDFPSPDLRVRCAGAVRLVAKLRAKGHKVYLHCTAGLNRSPTVAAAYLAWTRGLKAGEACDLVIEARMSSPDEEAVEMALMELGPRTRETGQDR